MRHLAIFGCAAALLAAAGAPAQTPEARNPIHCSIAFQVSYDLVEAAQGRDGALAKELHGRLVWQAFAAARFPKAIDADAEAEALRKQFTDDPEAGVAMTQACMMRQDAHPLFQAAQLERQLREGVADEPPSLHASLAELKDVFEASAPAAAAAQE